MRFRTAITYLVLIIAALSAVAAVTGVIPGSGPGRHAFTAVTGQSVMLHGHGLYRNDSVSAAAQAMAQDVVTIAIGIPLLLIGLILSRQGSLKGRLLLAGTLGYFLYTYTSLLFLATYNQLFLVYAALFSASLAAFILTMMAFDVPSLAAAMRGKLPIAFIGWFQVFVSAALLVMWLGRIVPPLIGGTVPAGLDQYTTLVIQGLDLGIMVPLGIVSGTLLLRRDAYGYLLSSVTMMKAVTMLTAISAMIVGQLRVGDAVPLAMIVIFVGANAIAIYCAWSILRSVPALDKSC